MDWVAIASAGVCGAVGGALGALVGLLFKNNAVRGVLTVICAVAALQLGRMFVTPWVEIEVLFDNQPPEIKQMIALAPDHVDELKALMREAYSKGGSPDDFQRAGYVWGRKYAAKPIGSLMASRNDQLVLRSFNTYMDIFKAVYTHDPLTCFNWIEGIGAPTEAELGLDSAADAKLKQLFSDTALLNEPEYAPLKGQERPAELAKAVVAKVRANWDASRIDFEDTAKPDANLPAEKKKAVCYTAFAIFSEVGALPEDQRLIYLRGTFGGGG